MRNSLVGLITGSMLLVSAAMADEPRADIELVADSMEKYFQASPDAMVQNESLNSSSRWQASIRLHTADELKVLLARAEKLTQTLDGYPDREPVAFVLYGDEIDLFRHENYERNRELVDLAARLEAYKVVDLKVCETWMGDHHIEGDQLPAFLDSVHNGEDEVRRLEASGYSYF